MAVCARQDSFVGEKIFEHIDVGFVRAPAYQCILVGSRSFVTVDPGRESSFGERSVFERKVICVTSSWLVVVLLSCKKAPSSAFSNRVYKDRFQLLLALQI